MIKKILCSALSLAMLSSALIIPASSAKSDLPFTDLNDGSWYCEPISYVWENNIMRGMTPTTFEPETTMSRAMFVTVIGRLCGAEEKIIETFPDVIANSYYGGYVGWAVDAGIVKGYDDDTFKPDVNVSREEAAAMITRYVSYDDLLIDWVRRVPGKFKDADKIAEWAADSVDELSLMSIILGDDTGRFNPSKNLTRAEAAAILMRLDTAVKASRSTTSIVSAYDMINDPESVYSNMDSTLTEKDGLPVMSFTPHEYFSAPWYIGINYVETDVEAGALEYTKICYKTEADTNPYLTVKSPVYESEKIDPVSVTEDDGYTTALFKTGDLIRSHRESYLNAENPYKKEKLDALKNLNIRSLYSTYLKIAVYPFGDEGAGDADVMYIAFSSTEKDAKALSVSSASDYLKSGRDEGVFIGEATNEVVSSYKKEMDGRIDDILDAKNAITPDDIKGTCYYISSEHGDDSNDGLSPEKPWKSFKNIYDVKGNNILRPKVKAGDGIFLERGSVFYPSYKTNFSGDYVLPGESGITYAAYGKGPKPILTEALDVNGSMDWEKTQWKNVWKLSNVGLKGPESSPGYYDVGNIIVYDKQGNVGWGVKVIPMDPANPYAEGSVTYGIGEASNGFEKFETLSVPCENPSVVKNNLEYFHDFTDGSVYMYYNGGNPGDVFDKIIVSKRGNIVSTGGTNVMIDNISFKYTGSHGLSTGDASNFTVQNCTFEWIGGSLQSDNNYEPEAYITRFGNGFENWANADGLHIKNCYFNQIFDGAASTQVLWKDISIVNDFDIVDCVFKNSNSPVEIWNLAHDEVSANVTISGNYFLNEAPERRYGMQRLDGGGHKPSYRSASFISLSALDMITHERFIVEKNVFFMDNASIYGGRQFLYRGDDNGVMCRDNVFIGGKAGLSDTFAHLPDVDLRNSAYPPNSYEIRYNYVDYTEDFISKTWTALGCDRGSKFYFAK